MLGHSFIGFIHTHIWTWNYREFGMRQFDERERNNKIYVIARKYILKLALSDCGKGHKL